MTNKFLSTYYEIKWNNTKNKILNKDEELVFKEFNNEDLFFMFKDGSALLLKSETLTSFCPKKRMKVSIHKEAIGKKCLHIQYSRGTDDLLDDEYSIRNLYIYDNGTSSTNTNDPIFNDIEELNEHETKQRLNSLGIKADLVFHGIKKLNKNDIALDTIIKKANQNKNKPF